MDILARSKESCIHGQEINDDIFCDITNYKCPYAGYLHHHNLNYIPSTEAAEKCSGFVKNENYNGY